MYTKGTIVIDNDSNKTLHVRRALLDTGAHGGNYIGRKFLTANRELLQSAIKTSDSSVFLADGITELKIDESVDLTLMITSFSSKVVPFKANFCVIESMCDLILGLNDLILQAGEFLIEMVQRAVTFSRREERHDRTISLPAAVIRGALQSVTRSPSPFRPTTTPHDDPMRPSMRPSARRGRKESWRAPTLAHTTGASVAVAGGAEAVQSLPMLPSEPGQDLRRPWQELLERAPEEDATPFVGMFGELPMDPRSLAFMETSIDEARAEYLREISTRPVVASPAPTPTAGSSDAPAKSPKRGRFAPEMYDVPGFVEFLRDVAIKIFVPMDWTGIKVPPIEFSFDPNMEKSHRAKARPINPLRLEMVRTEVERLKHYHLKPSTSPIVSPISDADKATAPFVRVCGDYRYINTKILTEHQHIPLVRHELEKFAKFKFFVDLDMANSFHQFKLGLKTSNMLSIITPWGTFRPVYLPEGVSPASGVLQANMREIFKDFREWCVVIFDNFCIGGDSYEDIFEKFKRFARRCIDYNIVLKFSKCFFGWRDVMFFGYKCDGEGYQIDDDRKAAVRAIPFPTGLTPKIRTTRMQAFLGFALYFSYFVEHYSILAAPLYDMTVKGFDWDESKWLNVDYRALFDAFKELLCDSFKLIYPDWELPWILQADASRVGVGAILFQVRSTTDDSTGAAVLRREPIACISYKFSGAAVNWAVIKQEMYAIHWAVDKLQYYLRYKPFQVQTDHSNLLQMEKSSVAIITRWRLSLQCYPILSIIHVAGKENIAADFLSRVAECDYDMLSEDSKKQLSYLSLAVLANAPSTSDIEFDELEGFTPQQRLQFITSRESSMSCERGADPRNECDDVYCNNCCDDFAQLCNIEPIIDTAPDIITDMSRRRLEADAFTERVPEWDAVLKDFHSGPALHWGALRTWKNMQESVVHKIPFEYVKFYIRNCGTCQKFRKTLTNYRIEPVVRHLKVSSARSTLGMDGFSVTPPDIHGNNYMHVVVNMFTKHVYLYVCKDKTATTGADSIVTYMALFGRHDRLMTDPGSDYTSKVVDELNKYLSYTHRFSLVGRHESNGTEPTNRELKRHIQTLVFDANLADRWSEPRVIALIAMEINSHQSSESGFSAFDLVFGTKSREYFAQLGAESLLPADRYSDYIRQLDQDISNLHECSREFQLKIAQSRATDISTPRNHWQPGDLVLLDNLDPANKIQAPRLGPFKVVEHVTNKNEVFLVNLNDKVVLPFFVGRLSLYTGTIDEALKGARADRDQHLILRLSGYRGDVETRQTLEFRVEFTDGTIVWKLFDRDLAGTAQLESYCVSLPQLRPLLVNASEAAKQRSALSKLATADTHPEGTVIFVDIRTRRIYESEFYLALVLEHKDIRHRYAELIVGKNVSVRGTRKGSRVELIDRAYGLAHIVDNYFLYVNGSVRDILNLPTDSEVIDADFARAHPYVPINTNMHRRLTRRDLGTITTLVDTVRVWSCNVNGIFSALEKGLVDQIKEMPGGSPDLLFMQEMKAHPSEEARLERIFAAFGYKFFCMMPGPQSQYQGVAVASKSKFILLGNIPVERGRALSIRVHGTVITNIYAPIVCNSQDEMIQRRQDFDVPLIEWVRHHPEPQLICGDLNAVQDIAIDLEVPTRMRHSFFGFQSNCELRLLRELQSLGFKDTFRVLNPFERAFTCFPRGSWKGMKARIDFILANEPMMERVLDSRVMPKTPVSDHAAVLVTITKPKQPDAWPDFSKMLDTPRHIWDSWLGFTFTNKPGNFFPPTIPRQENQTVFRVHIEPTEGGAPPPPPPPPRTTAIVPDPPNSSPPPPTRVGTRMNEENLRHRIVGAILHAAVPGTRPIDSGPAVREGLSPVQQQQEDDVLHHQDDDEQSLDTLPDDRVTWQPPPPPPPPSIIPLEDFDPRRPVIIEDLRHQFHSFEIRRLQSYHSHAQTSFLPPAERPMERLEGLNPDHRTWTHAEQRRVAIFLGSQLREEIGDAARLWLHQYRETTRALEALPPMFMDDMPPPDLPDLIDLPVLDDLPDLIDDDEHLHDVLNREIPATHNDEKVREEDQDPADVLFVFEVSPEEAARHDQEAGAARPNLLRQVLNGRPNGQPTQEDDILELVRTRNAPPRPRRQVSYYLITEAAAESQRELGRTAQRNYDQALAANMTRQRAEQPAVDPAHEATFSPQVQEQRALARQAQADNDILIGEMFAKREADRTVRSDDARRDAEARLRSVEQYREIVRQRELISIEQHRLALRDYTARNRRLATAFVAEAVQVLQATTPTPVRSPQMTSPAATNAFPTSPATTHVSPTSPDSLWVAQALRFEEEQHHQLQLDHHAELDVQQTPPTSPIPPNASDPFSPDALSALRQLPDPRARWQTLMSNVQLPNEVAAASPSTQRRAPTALVAGSPLLTPARSERVRQSPTHSMPWTASSIDTRPSVYEGGTPRDLFPSATSPDTAQPDSPLTADPPQRRAGFFDYFHAINNVDVDLNAGLIPTADLAVGPSIYMGMHDGEFADNMGDALSAAAPIATGRMIATFRGTRISRQAARHIPHGQNNYLISMQDNTVLDCMSNATARPPTCLASIANQADGAYDTSTGRILTYNDNNAYVVWRIVNDVMEATLYAVRQIEEGEEIMWSYGPSFQYGFDASTVYSTSSEEPDDNSSGGSRALSPDPLASSRPRGARHRLRTARRRLRAAGFTHYEDAFPEYAFSNASPVTSDGSSISIGRHSSQSPVRCSQRPITHAAVAATPPPVAREQAPRRRIVPTRVTREDDSGNAKMGPAGLINNRDPVILPRAPGMEK